MKKEQSLVWGKATFFLSALLLSQAFSSSAFAFPSGATSDCTGCHTGGATTVMIMGPDQVAAHSTNTYTLEISGDGPGFQGGLNVRALAGGVLGLVDAATQLDSGQITHTAPKAFSGNTVSWLFEWEAPVELGSYDLIGWGVNGLGENPASNDFAGMTTFTVQVVPIPAAAVLFGSALGVLGWLRRRAT